MGRLAVSVTAYVAAVLLTWDARRLSDDAMIGYFRVRAVVAGAWLEPSRWLVSSSLRSDARYVFAGLTSRALPLVMISALAGLGALLLLRGRPRRGGPTGGDRRGRCPGARLGCRAVGLPAARIAHGVGCRGTIGHDHGGAGCGRARRGLDRAGLHLVVRARPAGTASRGRRRRLTPAQEHPGRTSHHHCRRAWARWHDHGPIDAGSSVRAVAVSAVASVCAAAWLGGQHDVEVTLLDKQRLPPVPAVAVPGWPPPSSRRPTSPARYADIFAQPTPRPGDDWPRWSPSTRPTRTVTLPTERRVERRPIWCSRPAPGPTSSADPGRGRARLPAVLGPDARRAAALQALLRHRSTRPTATPAWWTRGALTCRGRGRRPDRGRDQPGALGRASSARSLRTLQAASASTGPGHPGRPAATPLLDSSRTQAARLRRRGGSRAMASSVRLGVRRHRGRTPTR